MKLTPSGSQTVGPFFRIGLEHLYAQPAPEKKDGMLLVRGRVLDGTGLPVPDAVLEVWQTNESGSLISNPPERIGQPDSFIRAATNDEGAFSFFVREPESVSVASELEQAPHIAVLVFARGLLRHLITRMYFPNDRTNAFDPILQSIPEGRQKTLIASAKLDDPQVLEWNVVLQGDDETVFFAW